MSESFFDYYHYHSKRNYVLPWGSKLVPGPVAIPKLKQADLMPPKPMENGGDVLPLIEVDVPNEIGVRDLARIVRVKPFKVIADLMEMKLYVNINQNVPFETAVKILRKCGFIPRRVG